MACTALVAAINSQRPIYACVCVMAPIPSLSTFSLIRTTSINAPTHKVRLVNTGAIAEP